MNRHEKIYQMPFATLYQAYLNKAARKNHTKEEVDELIFWLLGYQESSLQEIINQGTVRDFIFSAPNLNPNRSLIGGSICGVKIETIEDPLMKEIRYLDKIIDELCKGKAIAKIKRK